MGLGDLRGMGLPRRAGRLSVNSARGLLDCDISYRFIWKSMFVYHVLIRKDFY